MEARPLTLAHKPHAALQLSIHRPEQAAQGEFRNTLVVFLNGLSLPRAAWLPAATQLLALRQQSGASIPSLLFYDRYGQGESDSDPTDAPDTPYGHDLETVANDLHALVERVCSDDLGAEVEDVRLILVANSIGCALARLYTAAHPGQVDGLLLLDPMIANTDFVSLIPDVDAPGFDATELASGVSADDLRNSRAMVRRIFHPSSPNGEKLDRRNLAELLPYADKPTLPSGPYAPPPLLVVVGHDWDVFADQSEKIMKIPKAVTQTYVNPPWAAYNAGLAKLAEDVEVKIAKGCGHFVQKDDPAFVAAELNSLLDQILKRWGA